MARMTRMKKLGPVSRIERARYRARIANDADWGRPTLPTAKRACELVDVDPKTELRMSKDSDGDTAARALVVALDYVISFGDQGTDGAQLTFTGLFGALAQYWSIAYRDAMSRGAMVPYDMAEETLTGRDGAWREVQAAGVNVEAIWELLNRQNAAWVSHAGVPTWARVDPHPGLSKLFALRRVRDLTHGRGSKVWLLGGRYGSTLVDDVRQEILGDAQYRRPVRLRLLLADDQTPALPTRQRVCEERPYDVVTQEKRSDDVIEILESARLRFHVARFREDCERDARLMQTFRPVYEQAAGFGDDIVAIRSRFFRALNRRFHAHDFWPEHVPGELRHRWFSPARIEVHGYIDDGDGGNLFIEDELSTEFIERDVSSSQTQILSVFVGEPDLEALATSQTLKFKRYLAQKLWAFHQQELTCPCGSGDVHAPLASGYSGPNDERLVEFIKEIWMRRNYGGKLGKTVQDIAKASRKLAGKSSKYGPGWNANIRAKGGVRAATRYFEAFLRTLPPWIRTINTFLDACKHIGRHADPDQGVVLIDPLDGAEVRWNPIGRATKWVPAGSRHLGIRLPGGLAKINGCKREFVSRPWRVSTGKLSKRVAPCLVHMLDAYFNALVLEYLHYVGVHEIIAVHDAWFVPDYVDTLLQDDDYGALSGAQVLGQAIEYVGQEWLSGVGRVPDPDKPLRYSMTDPDAVIGPGLGRERLGPPNEKRPGLGAVYNWFVESLKGSEYEDFAENIRARWQLRVAQRRWPQFIAI
jgi:hypothetical protein